MKTNKNLVTALVNKYFGADYLNKHNFDTLATDITVDGTLYKGVYLIGDDEMYDGNDFYQLGVIGNKIYAFYFNDCDDEGNVYEDLGSVDYSTAYDVKDVSEAYNLEFDDQDGNPIQLDI